MTHLPPGEVFVTVAIMGGTFLAEIAVFALLGMF